MVKIDDNLQWGKKVVVQKQTLFTRFLITLFLMLGLFVLAAVITYLPTLFRRPTIVKDYYWCLKNGGGVDSNTYPEVCTSKEGEKFLKPTSVQEEKLLESPMEKDKPVSKE